MNYNEILKTLQDYYSNLLIVQYNGKTKAKATIEKLVNLIYSNMILLQIEYAFDWKTAVGKQLDIIGQWVGVNRSYNIQALQGRTLLAYPQTSRLLPKTNTSSKQYGYTDYSHYSSIEDGGVLRYSDLNAIDKTLTDDEFRVVIGLKIIFNNINHTAGEIDEAVWNYFGGETLYSSQDFFYQNQKLYTDEELNDLFGLVDKTDGISVNDVKYRYSNSETIEAPDGTSYMSSDILNLSLLPSPSPNVIYDGTRFIAVGTGKSTSYSDDGINWTMSIDANLRDDACFVAYDGSMYMRVFRGGGYFSTSSDAETWTTSIRDDALRERSPKCLIYNSVLNDFIVYNEDHSYCVYNKYANQWTRNSLQGENITVESIAYSPYQSVFGNGVFICVYAGRPYFSEDGRYWYRMIFEYNDRGWKLPAYNKRWSKIYFDGSKFIVLQNDGKRLMTSETGEEWKVFDIDLGSGSGWENLAYNGTRYIAISNTRKISVSNGVYKLNIGNVYTTWQSHQLTYNYPQELEKLMDYCEYKRVLPAPTGVNILLTQY